METIERAANAIHEAEALLFTAGAGIGVDSGLPDFRGDEGFWQAYPPFRELGLSFSDLANSRWFTRDPRLAWGFYGHRLNLYRATVPHAGFGILKKWGDQKAARVLTSNVDGQFQKAGIEAVSEIHGSIAHFQCAKKCGGEIWDAPIRDIVVDEISFRAMGPLPQCPQCGGIARPNILMFNDNGWIYKRSRDQAVALDKWLNSLDLSRLAVIEIGAGTAIPSVRHFGEHLQKRGATLIRINLRESQGPSGTLSLALRGREALEKLDVAVG